MTDFLFIHGAGDFASSYRLVVAELEALGHRAVAVDLPCDEPEAGLDAYVETAIAGYAAALGDHADGRELVVVGHSLGGFTAPLVAERLDAAQLVFLSAMLPRTGEPPSAWWAATGYEAAAAAAREADPHDPEDEREVFFQDLSDELAAQLLGRDQTDAVMRDPWPGEWPPRRPTRILAFAQDRMFPLEFQRTVAAERLPDVEVEQMPGSHCAMLSRPAELARRLTQARPGTGAQAMIAAGAGAGPIATPSPRSTSTSTATMPGSN